MAQLSLYTVKILVPLVALILLVGSSPIGKLERPFYEWVPCSCNEPAVMGLSEQHFIVYQMYMSGLEYEYEKCNKQ